MEWHSARGSTVFQVAENTVLYNNLHPQPDLYKCVKHSCEVLRPYSKKVLVQMGARILTQLRESAKLKSFGYFRLKERNRVRKRK